MAAVMRACIECGRPSPSSRCEHHKPKPRGALRRERMGLSGGAWETIRKQVLARDQGCCYLCGRLGADEVDHLVQVAAGGSNLLPNLASTHGSCHRRRHREPEWARERIEAALEVLGELGPDVADLAPLQPTSHPFRSNGNGSGGTSGAAMDGGLPLSGAQPPETEAQQ